MFYERITKNCTYLPNEPKQCRNSIFDFNLPPRKWMTFLFVFICWRCWLCIVVFVRMVLVAFVKNSMSPAIQFCSNTFTLTIYIFRIYKRMSFDTSLWMMDDILSCVWVCFFSASLLVINISMWREMKVDFPIDEQLTKIQNGFPFFPFLFLR